MAGVNNDPFEEFEFRPINEGLGFHRKQKASSNISDPMITEKTTNVSNPKSTPSVISNSISNSNSNLNVSVQTSAQSFMQEINDTKQKINFKSPLPRNDSPKKQMLHIPTIEDDSMAKSHSAVNDILKSLNQKRQIDFANEKEKQKNIFKKSKPQLLASTLDGLLIFSAFLMTLIIMLSVTKVDLFLNLSHKDTSSYVYFATGLLFFSVYFIYMVVNRAFNGFTPGEWAFDQVCGNKDQFGELTYIPKIIFRSLLVAFTGFIVLNILSYFFNKDMAGEFSGIYLFEKPNA